MPMMNRTTINSKMWIFHLATINFSEFYIQMIQESPTNYQIFNSQHNFNFNLNKLDQFKQKHLFPEFNPKHHYIFIDKNILNSKNSILNNQEEPSNKKYFSFLFWNENEYHNYVHVCYSHSLKTILLITFPKRCKEILNFPQKHVELPTFLIEKHVLEIDNKFPPMIKYLILNDNALKLNGHLNFVENFIFRF
jgi:hypothetical protein